VMWCDCQGLHCRENQRRLNDKKRKQQKKSSRGGKGDWS
jgi:hypothetical protein